MTSVEIWTEVLKKMQAEYFMSPTEFSAFIRVLKPICIKDNNLILLAPNRFTLNIVERRFLDHLEKAMASISPMKLKLIPPDEEEDYVKEADEVLPVVEDYLMGLGQFWIPSTPLKILLLAMLTLWLMRLPGLFPTIRAQFLIHFLYTVKVV